MHVEELAGRIAAGEAVAPEEVVAVLDHCGVTEAQLQAAVDRHARVIELRKLVAPAAGLEKRLAAIEAEVSSAETKVKAARNELDRITARVSDEHMTLRHRLDAIEHARRKLMSPENLPPDIGERLTAARDASNSATDAVTARSAELTDRRARLRRAEEELPRAERQAALWPGHADFKDAAQRARNAVKARREQVADAERALAEARRASSTAAASLAAAERAAAAAVEESVAVTD